MLAEDLTEAGLGNVDVLLEYQLPLTSQRADVVLAGTHPDTGRPSYVVVELKQWSSARLWEGDENLVEVRCGEAPLQPETPRAQLTILDTARQPTTSKPPP